MTKLSKLTSREKALTILSSPHKDFDKIKRRFMSDLEFVIEATQIDGSIIEHINEELRSNEKIILTAVSTYPEAILYLPKCSNLNIHIFDVAFWYSKGGVFAQLSDELIENLRLIISAIDCSTADENNKDFDGIGMNQFYDIINILINTNIGKLLCFLGIYEVRDPMIDHYYYDTPYDLSDYDMPDYDDMPDYGAPYAYDRYAWQLLASSVVSFLKIMHNFPDNKLRTSPLIDTHFHFQ